MRESKWEQYLIDTSTLSRTKGSRTSTSGQQHHVTRTVAGTLVPRKRGTITLPPVDTLGAILGKDDFEVTQEMVMQIKSYFQRLDIDEIETGGITSRNRYTILKTKKEYLKTKLSLDGVDSLGSDYLLLWKGERAGIFSFRNNTFILLPTPETQASYFAYVSGIAYMEYANMTDAMMVGLSGGNNTETLDEPTLCVGYVDSSGTFCIIDTSGFAGLRNFSELIGYISGCAVASGGSIKTQEKLIH